jgi:hypothetical protein
MDVVAVNLVGMGMLVGGCAVTVSVRVMMTADGSFRRVMSAIQSAVQHERNRRHERHRGRETPERRMDGTNHRSSEFMLRYQQS